MELPHASAPSHTERYLLNGSDDIVRFAVGKNVILNVETELSPRERDSARANSRVLADYKWEAKSAYPGRILGARDKLLAYRLFNENTGEAVRVLERENRVRHLIKDFRHGIVDLQWAVHSPLLAVLDANANLYLYQVDDSCTFVNKFLNIIRDEDSVGACSPKFSWCPYIYFEDESGAQQTYLLAVAYGKKFDLFAPYAIKYKLGRVEVRFSELADISGAYISYETESDITAIRISPDATAVAVSTADGQTTFYVIDGDKIRKAQSVSVLSNQHVEDMVFLDNLLLRTQDHWKHVVVSSDNGRRLAVFDCDNWECLGKLRFESSTQIQRFEISVEPTGRFVFVADYDACNLFCIEICRDSHGPRFASCTQITFCNPLICIAPIGLNDAVESLDLSLEDDDGAANTAVVASFVVITHRSLVELMVDLEHTHTEYVCSTGSVRGQEEIEGSSLNISTNSAPKTIAKNHSPRPTSGGGGAVAKLLEAFEDRFGAMNERIDDITNQLEQVQKDNAEQQEHLCDVLEKISHEVRERDERTDANVKNLTSLVRDELFQIVERSMNANTTTLQNSLESTNERAIETIRSSISQVLVPAVDELCSQLFNQLNEAFRDGLQEFVEQIRKVQSTAPTPLLPDYSTLLQLVEANQTVQAFEMVLSRHDTASLMFLCNKLDPDTLFNGVTPFPATVLFALLQQLSQSLDRDTDLKFRYIENILLALDNEDPPVQRNEQFRVTLHQLSQALTLFMALDVKASYKRQTRIINQLIVTLLR